MNNLSGSSNGHNPLKPMLAELVQVADMGVEIKLFRVRLLNDVEKPFQNYLPGQFAFLSAFGVGEAPFGIASTPARGETLDFAVQRLGSVTTALHELEAGDLLGVRGPMGNGFPMADLIGNDIVVLGGGIGGAPLRPVIQYILDHREQFGHLSILWAARQPDLLIFTDEYDEWRSAPDTELHLTVDHPDQRWDHHVGLITDLLKSVSPPVENTVAITCGPPVMIHYASMLLEEMGFDPTQQYMTLEARMHCGIGKCGRCNMGEKLVCVDGPVFSLAEVKDLLEPVY